MGGKEIIEQMIARAQEESEKHPSWPTINGDALRELTPYAEDLYRRATESGMIGSKVNYFVALGVTEIHKLKKMINDMS